MLCKEVLSPNNISERWYVVKYRRLNNPASNAAAISEVVSHALLKMIGLRTLDAALVEISPELAVAYARSGLLDRAIDGGLHFGTRFRSDFVPVDFAPIPSVPTWEQMARPEELIAIWAADTWLMNLDREVFGNILMEPEGNGSVWHLIPADQSDCFLGAGSLADGSYQARSLTRGPAPYLPMLERALYEKGPEPLQRMVRQIGEAKGRITEATALVPQDWWDKSGVKPGELTNCLHQRADRIHTLVELAKWKGIPHGPDGDITLDL